MKRQRAERAEGNNEQILLRIYQLVNWREQGRVKIMRVFKTESCRPSSWCHARSDAVYAHNPTADLVDIGNVQPVSKRRYSLRESVGTNGNGLPVECVAGQNENERCIITTWGKCDQRFIARKQGLDFLC